MSFSNTMPIAATRTTIRTPSAQAWFAGGERVGYDPKARAIVAAQDPPLKILLRREGELAHAVSSASFVDPAARAPELRCYERMSLNVE